MVGILSLIISSINNVNLALIVYIIICIPGSVLYILFRSKDLETIVYLNFILPYVIYTYKIYIFYILILFIRMDKIYYKEYIYIITKTKSIF